MAQAETNATTSRRALLAACRRTNARPDRLPPPIRRFPMTLSEPQALEADRPRSTRESRRDVPSGPRVA